MERTVREQSQQQFIFLFLKQSLHVTLLQKYAVNEQKLRGQKVQDSRDVSPNMVTKLTLPVAHGKGE